MKKIVSIFALCLVVFFAKSQEKKYKVACVGFYNLENLFDTIDQPDVNDADFLPTGSYHYTSEVYWDKLNHLSTVISQIGTDITPDGLAIMGTAEIENQTCLEDLVKNDLLKSRNYKIIEYDSPDQRGIDCALLYNPKYFTPEFSAPIKVDLKLLDTTSTPTRDILYVKGNLDGETVHIFVNHWPSRRGGEEASAPRRELAASICKKVIDSLMKIDPNTKVILMGDLNDNPTDKSMTKILGVKADPAVVKPGGIYSPWIDFYKKGLGTLGYQDAWSLFDQSVFSYGWLNKNQDGYFFNKAYIFKKEYMIEKIGNFKDYPKRTFAGSIYNAGYSDHLPTYVILLKEIK